MLTTTKIACAFAVFAAAPVAAFANDPESCAQVRLAEPGWNDLALTSATAKLVLDALGYQTKSDLLGIEIIYQSMKNGELDAFLGYWDPAMQIYASPYEADGSVERINVNLEGAKYTFGVPAFVAEAGVRDIKDLAKFADKFDKKMYGIEPGSNQLMLDVINDPAFGLEGWEVVESSEAGMLAQVERSVAKQSFIVFQAWAPHPMNTAFDLVYLTGGDAQYGPNLGAATVSTQVRKGYLAECPNVGLFLKNIRFSIDFESEGMGYMSNDGMDSAAAAMEVLKKHPDVLTEWLSGVTTLDGKPGLEAVTAALQL